MSEVAQLKLTKDLKQLAGTLTANQARYLVDYYISSQEDRIRANNQSKALEKAEEPHAVIDWAKSNAEFAEKEIAKALKFYAEAQPMGQWAMSVKGVGAIFAASLLAHIDITKAPTVGHIWAFAGLDPSKKWEKGQKRPWNAALKRTCYLIAVSFEKLHNDPECFYGRIYNERKAYEQAKNESGDYKAQAEAALKAKKIGKDTEAFKAYSVGKLPPGHIRARVLRYVAKLFLSHWHDAAYRQHFNTEPPKPYPIAIQGHAHFIAAAA